MANNIIIWGHSLHKRKNGSIVKAVGILDGDMAGIEAKKEVNRVIKSDSKKAKTFKIFKLAPSYARHLIPLYQNNLKLPITLEELFPLSIWEAAQKNGWLEPRKSSNMFLESPKNWNQMNQSLTEFISDLPIDKKLLIYMNKVKDENKKNLTDYISNLPLEKRKAALINFQSLLNDIDGYLFS